MPALWMLTSTNATITGEGARWLAQGFWPCLVVLNLSQNQLDAEAARHIVSGVWPLLRSLPLEENLFGDDGLQQLTKGNRPLLDSLAISLNMLKRQDTIALLGLDTNRVQQIQSQLTSKLSLPLSGTYSIRVPRSLGFRVSRADECLWPKLKEVKVSIM